MLKYQNLSRHYRFLQQKIYLPLIHLHQLDQYQLKDQHRLHEETFLAKFRIPILIPFLKTSLITNSLQVV